MNENKIVRTNQNILIVIIARGGSKGVPNKNLYVINGKPLVVYSIENANIIKTYNNNVDHVLSTDCPQIRDIAIASGAWAPFIRPAELAEDHVESYPVVKHALFETEKIKGKNYEIVVYLQPTSPLCRPEDIVKCINLLGTNSAFNSAVAVTPVSTHPFKMKRLLKHGQLVNYIDQGFEDMRARQVLPKVYRRAGSVYASRRHVVLEEETLVSDQCGGIEVPCETAVDIDNYIDIKVVEVLMQERIKNKDSYSTYQ